MENVIMILIGICAVVILPIDILFLAALIAFDAASRMQRDEDWRSGQGKEK